jgi:hypothetical protein
MKRRVAYLLAFFAVASCFGFAEAKPSVTQPFDEFGRVGHCDLGARLDNFAISLQNDPSVTGYIVTYGPEGEGAGSGRSRLKLMKDYLVDARGLPQRRIKTVYAGRNEEVAEPKTQLWIVPPGQTLPEPRKFQTSVDTFKGLFHEDAIADYIDIFWEDEMGPGIGPAFDAAFADMLQQQKKSIAYIVSYNGYGAVPGSAKRATERQLERLKQHQVDFSRVKTIFGGVRNKTKLQLWITAAGDPPPVNDAGDEPAPRKNVEVTSQSDFTLGVAQNERAVFNRMLEVLRTHPALKAVVIVSLEGTKPEPEPEPEAKAETTTPTEPLSLMEEEDPPADLPKLVQKWRDELVNTHKIKPERFVVLFATSPSDETISYGNFIELWAVPPGEPLPDPNAKRDEEEVEEIDDQEPSLGARIGLSLRKDP